MRQFYSVQYLRAIAALSVVYHHAASKAGLPTFASAAGVDVFFVISGFIMWTVTENREQTPGQFLWHRVARIVPTYWLYTFLLLAMVSAGLTQQTGITFGHMLGSLFFIPCHSPDGQPYPVLYQGWTLNYEMFFYLLFSVALLAGKTIRLIAILTTLSLLTLIGTLISSENVIVRTYTNPILVEFGFGLLLGYSTKRVDIGRTLSRSLVATGILGFALVSVATIDQPRLLSWGVPAALLVFGGVFYETSGNVVQLRIPRILGDASYSIYLAHTFVVSALFRVVGQNRYGFVIAAVVASAIVGVISYWLIEKLLLKLARRKIVFPFVTKAQARTNLIAVSSPEGIALQMAFVRSPPQSERGLGSRGGPMGRGSRPSNGNQPFGQ
ncbi:acyltransferase family protein [Bradyrhizobium hipponense]|nr:acyltransferase [Bradyrhizobium hipponense]